MALNIVEFIKPIVNFDTAVCAHMVKSEVKVNNLAAVAWRNFSAFYKLCIFFQICNGLKYFNVDKQGASRQSRFDFVLFNKRLA